MFDSSHISALSSSSSDHAPLFIVGCEPREVKKSFRFESFWLKLPDFMEVTAQSWNRPIGATNPLAKFHLKLCRLGRDLKRWSRTHVGDIKLRLAIANEVIFQLEVAQESRILSDEEYQLRKDLKLKVLGLASMEKIRIRQRSRLTWLKTGDVNSKFFHLKANSRRRKNYIHSLETPFGLAVTKDQKMIELNRFFNLRLGVPCTRLNRLNWARINLPSVDLSELEADFDEEEIKDAILNLAPEKAPGPDGFTGAFFKCAWEIIKTDLLMAITHFGNLHSHRLQDLNLADICLIPKKEEVRSLEDYKPISLIHSFAKIISKMLANRLAPKLNELVSQNQSAFIRKRAIHDNFLYTQNMVKQLNRKKKASLLIKVDISRAFDSVNWAYLLETLQHFGFGHKWINWVANLLGSCSSRILLNGIPGDHIFHARGLRQGDPLSPMLFILVMEPLHQIIKAAEDVNIISNLCQRQGRFRCSLYADDVALFALPTEDELIALKRILLFFAQISGLHTNMSKTEIYPISCSDIDLDNILTFFPGNKKNFPCKYLGLPLHTRKLKKIDLQP